MEVVKETKDYQIVKKRSGRYGVRSHRGKWLNGADKIKILVDEGLIKTAVPQAEPQAEAASESAAAAAADTSAEEAATDAGAETEADDKEA